MKIYEHIWKYMNIYENIWTYTINMINDMKNDMKLYYHNTIVMKIYHHNYETNIYLKICHYNDDKWWYTINMVPSWLWLWNHMEPSHFTLNGEPRVPRHTEKKSAKVEGPVRAFGAAGAAGGLSWDMAVEGLYKLYDMWYFSDRSISHISIYLSLHEWYI